MIEVSFLVYSFYQTTDTMASNRKKRKLSELVAEDDKMSHMIDSLQTLTIEFQQMRDEHLTLKVELKKMVDVDTTKFQDHELKFKVSTLPIVWYIILEVWFI